MEVHVSLNSWCRSRLAGAPAMLLALALISPSPVNAPGSSSATVLGTVTDASGAVIPRASVQVKNLATGQVQQAPVDAQGRYTIAGLAIGSYEAQDTAQGFQTTLRRGLTLTVGAQAVVDFSLAVGQSQ